MNKFILLFCFLLLGFSQISFAQDRVITGKVSSKEDEGGLPGVNIQIKGTTTGTLTDFDGNYKISTPANATLVFSFVGMKTTEVVVGNQTNIDLSMEADAKMIGEVIVTAVGIERNSRQMGYSVEQVASEKLMQRAEPDLLRSMQGKVPGVNITSSGGAAGSSSRITIRGNNSFFGANQPLFVVDGIPYDNSFNESSSQRDNGAAFSSRIADLDPNNIASMTVLKGAAAAALYGTRAANGVIVITTKSGSAKMTKKGLEITANLGMSVEDISSYPNFQNKYGAGSQQVYANANGTWGPAFGLGRTYNAAGGWTPNTTGTDSIPIWVGYNTFANQYPTLAGQSGLRPGGNVAYRSYPDNVKNFFRQGVLREYSVSIAGGGPKASLSAVFSHTDQDSYFPGSTFKRTNISVGGSTTLDNGIQISANLAYTNSLQTSPLFGSDGTSPLSRLFQMPRNWPLDQLPYQDPTGQGVFFFPFGQADNAYWSVNNSTFKSDVNRLAASGSISYDIYDWLKVTYKGGLNTYNDNRLQRISAGSLFGAQGIGSLQQDAITFQEQDHNFLINASRKVNEDFTVRAIVGANYNQRTNSQFAVNGLGIIVPNIDLISNVSTATPNNNSGYDQRRLWAVFADVTLSYKDYLHFNLTARNDNSSTLPVNNRSYFYYSASGSFIFTEALKIKSNFLTSGKFRLGYARVGRDASPYQTINTFRINRGEGSGVSGATRNNDYPFRTQSGASVAFTSFDPNLKPEFTSEIETGLNLEFFKGRVTLDATYYDRSTTNVIASRSLPQSTGFGQVLTNFGEIRNYGMEVGLNVVPIQAANGFQWDIYTAFTLNRNVVVKLEEGINEVVLRNLIAGNPTPIVRPGEEFGLLRGTAAARDANGNLLINPATGLVIPDIEQRIIGNPNARFLLGVTNTFTYKGFSLSALVDYRHGGSLFSWTNQFYMGRGVTQDTENREVPRVVDGVLGNVNTLQPILGADGQPVRNNIQVMENNLWFQASGNGALAINGPNEYSIYDASVFRLREITFGYNLPKAWLAKTPFGSVNLSLNGRNLFFFAPNFPKNSNFDPEVSTLGNSNAQGFDFFATPSIRRFGFNLKVTF
ncbi:MAG: SusC/RagA family TonB-linked outer membrane protein [Bacteroidetes bacterium]|nr:MAG: SusC/RagA family TonB-linked outer membrane protein [Bacteroidota bacterium]